MQRQNTMSLSQWIDKAFWAMITAAVWLAVQYMSSMNSSIADMSADISRLNQKLAVLVYTTNDQNNTLRDHEGRLRDLEKTKP